VLAIPSDAARTLDTLEGALRHFDMGGSWAAVTGRVPDLVRDALQKFAALVAAALPGDRAAPVDADLVRLARVFRIVRFAQGAGSGWDELAHLLGRRLYGGDHAGDAPLTSVLAICRDLIRTGAPADRSGLLRTLRAEGHIDVSAPTFAMAAASARSSPAGPPMAPTQKSDSTTSDISTCRS
jgi:hypothetical protein